MKRITLLFIFFAAIASAQISKKKPVLFGKEISSDQILPSGHIRCAAVEYEDFLRGNNPKLETIQEFEQWIAPLIEKQENSRLSQTGSIIYIPVVVHVIHNGDAYGANENILDEQVISQITVMNQDFRRMAGSRGFNTNAVGADVEIEFVLAKVDPNGNPTNGINRVNLCNSSWSTEEIDSYVKPTTIWNPTFYMNMWSVNFTDDSLLGYATFPRSSGLSGLTSNYGSSTTDGVVANYSTFGSSDYNTGGFSLIAPYDKGRTMTHEVGHFLGLKHIWGDDGSCPATNTDTDKDYCSDTPAANRANSGCPTSSDTCPSNPGLDMVQNFMDYTNDSCMNIFTIKQKSRIIAVMNNSPRRNSLKTSDKNLPIPLFANDGEVKIDAYCSAGGASCAANHKVILYNRGTSNMTSASITYNVNGGTNSTYNWTGNLAPNKYSVIDISTTETNGNFNVAMATVNGVADQRATNNSATAEFSFPSITDYPYIDYTFNLIGDPYGDETSWELKNQSGTTLYSGGPYTFTGVAGTQVLVSNQSWTLPAGGCYTFKIIDVDSDGMSGSASNTGVPNNDAGSWTITTNSGATTVSSGGGNFGAVASASFTNASLSNSEFALESIIMYPNPSSSVLNVEIPASLGNNNQYEVFNNLGQVIKSGTTNSSNFSINTSNFSNGVYFLKLKVENATKTLKFIKN